MVSAALGTVALLASLPTKVCEETPFAIWQQCMSALGTLMPEWNPLVGVAIGVGVGGLAWWLLRFTRSTR